MDTGKNKMVGMRKKRALRGTLFAVILSASMSFSALAAMTADGPGMGTAAGASADTSDSTDSEQVLKTEAAPEEGPIRMDVVYGYDNVAKSGRFLPLDIQLDNTSEETFEGTLCVTSQEPDYDGYSNNSQEKYDTYRYEFPVMIQGDSSLEKKLNISLCSKSDLMYITLMDGAGNEVLSKRLKMDLNTDAAQLFIGVLCDEPERLSYLEQVGVNYSMLRTKTIDLSVYDLPDTELGLDQLDVLLITDFNSETLTEEQTEAIWEWVHRGGILLFGTGARGDETLSAFSKQLLEYPVSPGMVYEIQMGQDRTAREPGENILSLEGTEVDLKGGTDLLTSGSLTVLSATSVGNGKTLELKEMKLGDAGTFSGSVQLPAPKITAVVDADFSNPLNPIYREISVSLSEDVVAKAELKFSSKGKGTGKIYLGHVSAYLGEGFYADVVFYLNISADGKATIQYTLSNTLTASYINGDFRMNASCNGSWDGTQAEVNGQLLGEPQVNLRFLGCWFDNKLYGAIDIIGVQADAGAKLKATATVHDKKPKLCTNLDLYSYVSVGVNTDMGIGKWLKNHTKLTLTKVILDNNAANPLRGTWHYEDGKRTEGDKCTYKNKQSKNQQNEKQENKVKQNEETIDEKSAKDKIDIKQYKEGEWKKLYVKKMKEWEREEIEWEKEGSVELSENVKNYSQATLLRIPKSKIPLLVYYYRNSVVVIFYDKDLKVNCFGAKTTSTNMESREIEFYYSDKSGKGILDSGLQRVYSFDKNGAKQLFKGQIVFNSYYIYSGASLLKREAVTEDEYYAQVNNVLGKYEYQSVSSMELISGKQMKKLLLKK